MWSEAFFTVKRGVASLTWHLFLPQGLHGLLSQTGLFEIGIDQGSVSLSVGIPAAGVEILPFVLLSSNPTCKFMNHV